MRHILDHWLKIIFILSIVAIGSALIAEFFFKLVPCKMCLNQRYTYYLIICTVMLFYLLRFNQSIWFSIVNEIGIIYGLFYSIWHVGIEQQILNGPESCSGVLLKTDSIENLKEQIFNQAITSCTEIIWTIFGLSAATINSILLLFILFFNSIYIFKDFYGSKKIT